MITIIIQARMGSTRLPGKVLLPLTEGMSALAHMINRISYTKNNLNIIIATTENEEDDAIVEEAKNLGIPFFRGDEEDVLSRFYWAAKNNNAETIIRLTSDCPLYDVTLLDAMLANFLSSKNIDYLSNTLTRTYPRGYDTEIFTFSSLEKAYFNALPPHQREHVTPYFYENPDIFKLKNFYDEIDNSKYRLTLDTPEDLKLIKIIFDRLYKGAYFNSNQIFDLFKQLPELKEINAHIEQKKLKETL